MDLNAIVLAIIALGVTGSAGTQADDWNRQADDFSTVGYNGFQSTVDSNRYSGNRAFSSNFDGNGDGSYRSGGLNSLNLGGGGTFQARLGYNHQLNGQGQSNFGGERQNQGFQGGNGRQNQGSYQSNGRQDQYFEQDVLEALRVAIPGGGIPGQDYPILASVPITGFKCTDKGPGQFADPQQESRCQAFYTCQEDGRSDSFLCPNGTLYNQRINTCDWWYNVDCDSSEQFYGRNDDFGNDNTNFGRTNGGRFPQNQGFTQRTNNGFGGIDNDRGNFHQGFTQRTNIGFQRTNNGFGRNDNGNLHQGYLTPTNSYLTPNNRIQNNLGGRGGFGNGF